MKDKKDLKSARITTVCLMTPKQLDSFMEFKTSTKFIRAVKKAKIKKWNDSKFLEAVYSKLQSDTENFIKYVELDNN